MSETGLPNFDRTLQLTNTWLNEIGQAIGPDSQRQYHALRSVLFALRDRLTVEEAFHLSAQLPMLVRGVYWEGYRPVHKPEPFRSRQEFLDKVSETLDPANPVDPEDAARAVLAVLARNVPDGEVRHVKQMVPAEIRDLFPAGE